MSEVFIPKFTKEDFHIPEPRKPWRDPRAWGLVMPAIMGVIGLAAFAIVAYSFKELGVLSDVFRTNTVLVGAIALAIGGEVGTLFTNIEIFRKVVQGQANLWDWTAFVTSILATTLSFLVAAAALLGADVVWSDFVKTWLRIVLIMIASLDQYAGQMELGLYLGTYDQRYQEWEHGYHGWLDKMAQMYGLENGLALDQNYNVETSISDTQQMVPVKEELFELPNENWSVRCNDCGWMSNKEYSSEGYARTALKSHKRSCQDV